MAAGLLIGVAAAVSNLYVSLRTGWSLPVMTTAAVLGLAVSRRRGGSASSITLLTATASAAGYMSGGGNAAALPALVMLVGASSSPSLLAMAVYWIVIAMLGVALAPFLRRGTIDTLAFPTATATTTLALASEQGTASEEREAARSEGRALFRATVASAVFAVVRNAARVPPTLSAPGVLGHLTFGLDPSFLLAGAGALMTARTAISTLVGAVITYGWLLPYLFASGSAPELSYRASVSIMVWPCAALLVSSALVTFLLDTVRGLREPARAPKAREPAAPSHEHRRFFQASVIVLAIACGAVMIAWLGLPFSSMAMSLPLALALALVAARAMGETDIVPTKALTPLAQLVLGAVGEASLHVTTLAPNLTSGVALSLADTLGSMKVAAATKTSVKSVVLARWLGIIVGGAAVAMAYAVVVGRDADRLPSLELPAPGVLVWKSVAAISVEGMSALPSPIKTMMLIAAAIGITLAIAERASPRLAVVVPSAVGLGSGMVLPASNAIVMSLGALATVLARRRGWSKEVLPVASGLVAGESLVGLVWQGASAILP